MQIEKWVILVQKMFPACSKFLPCCGCSDHYLCGKEQRLHTSRVSTEQQLSKAVYLVDSVVTLLVLTVLKLLYTGTWILHVCSFYFEWQNICTICNKKLLGHLAFMLKNRPVHVFLFTARYFKNYGYRFKSLCQSLHNSLATYFDGLFRGIKSQNILCLGLIHNEHVCVTLWCT